MGRTLRSPPVVLRVEVPARAAEVAADLLWAAGASAVGEAEVDQRGLVVLTADLDACPVGVRDAGWAWSTWADDGTWADGWRPFARAVRAGPFLVRPPWVEAEVPPGVTELLLDGGRAFGTGSHPSTTLALELLATVVTPGGSVLDVGCGSGALAIGAALLGAARVVAVDVDAEAVATTGANAARNGVSVEVLEADASSLAGTFDVVVANLGAPLVFDLASRLAACSGSVIVLSGLLDARAVDVPRAYAGFAVTASRSTDGWTAMALARAG